MNKDSWSIAENLIPANYIKQAANATRTKENTIRQLLQHKTIPDCGWSDITIETLLYQLSSMDSNNYVSNCGIGERESRIASELVARRHYQFGHGIGRSGDLTEAQPKAAGSSLMYALTNCLFKDLMKLMGISSPLECLVIPVATGMALVMTMLSLRSLMPSAKYVIWLRIDQKSCFKSIITAGFEPVIIDTLMVNNQLETDIDSIEIKIQEFGSTSIACIMSTTSCFAPRGCDKIEQIAILCKKYNVPHLINNAYGLQCKQIMKRIQTAHMKGRVDAFVQSTDKNIMVPVGGSIVSCFNLDLLKEVAQTYPGRASSTPIMDSFITILHLGRNGYKELVDDREAMFVYLKQALNILADRFQEKVLYTPENYISISMTLSNIPKENLTKVGSMLFWRNISGTRVVTTLETKTISSHTFLKWGAHCNDCNVPYLTAAASLGIKKTDIDTFIKKLNKILLELQKESVKSVVYKDCSNK